MKRLLLAALVLFVVAPPVALPAPRAQTEGECRFLWDAALVARALALERVDGERAQRIIDRVYSTGADARMRVLITAVVAAAQISRSPDAAGFARELAEACLLKGGNMDAILGTSL